MSNLPKARSSPALVPKRSTTPNNTTRASGGLSNGNTNSNGHSGHGGVATNIKVAVRCRPLNDAEKNSNQASAVTCDLETNTVKVSYGSTSKRLTRTLDFDKVFGMYSRQHEVYESMVKPIIDEALNGFNCTIFAYGPTGTGKTYTMSGDLADENHWGMIPRAAKTIFDHATSEGADCAVKISYLEIYNEELMDLLVTTTDKRLKLMEDVKRGVICHNLEEFAVSKMEDCLEHLRKGLVNRQTAATLSNHNSSRSHAIFTFRIMNKEVNENGEEVVKYGQLNLVDLAGSECIGRSGAKDDRAREAGSINQSLLTLGRVITGLADMNQHIPYRDSKLTRLLQESLGGKAKTCIIATLSPAANAVEETVSTVDYAFRAKSIKNQPQVLASVNTKVVMKEIQQEIEYLKAQLMINREKNGVYVDPQDYYNMESKISAQENMISECESTIRQRDTEIETLLEEKRVLEHHLAEHKAEIHNLKTEVSDLKDNVAKCEGIIAERDAEIVRLLDIKKNLEDELTARNAEIVDLKGQVADLTSKLEDTTEKLNQTRAELEATKLVVADLQQQVADRDRKIAELEQEIVELKAKLKATEEKLKETEEELERTRQIVAELRAEVADCRAQIAQLTHDLEVMTAKQKDTEERLQDTYVELKACHKIIAEQKDTEAALHQQAETLQDQLMGREEEIRKLLAKVEALEKQESKRLEATVEYANALDVRQESILKKVTELHNQTEHQTKQYNDVVQQLLTSGQDQSKKLQSALEEALKQLVQNAQEAKDYSVQSCSKLDAYLMEQKLNTVDKLTSVQNDWKQWMEHSTTTFDKLQQHFNKNEAQSKELLETVQVQHKAFKTLSAAYFDTQKQLAKDLEARSIAVKEDIVNHSDKYEKATHEQMVQAQKQMENKVALIEKTVADLLQQLSKEAKEVFATVSSEATNATTATKSKLEKGLSELDALAKERGTKDQAHYDACQSWSKESEEKTNQQTNEIQTNRESATAVITAILPEIKSREEVFNKDTKNLLDELDASLNSNHEAVIELSAHHKTAHEKLVSEQDTAKKNVDNNVAELLKITQQKTDNIKSITTESQERYTSYANDQKQTTTKAQEETKTYVDTMRETRLVARGDTPSIYPQTAEVVFAQTRQHETIRKDIIDQHLAESTWRQNIFTLTKREI